MRLNAYRYRFPFVEPFTTGAGTFTDREGILFTLRLPDASAPAYGEAAPLPGFSRESIDDLLAYLEQRGDKLASFVERQAALDDPESSETLTGLPSLQFAVDTLLADARAKTSKKPLRALLFERSRQTVPVNATLPAGEPGRILPAADRYWQQGFRTFKIKVGIDFERERSVIAALRNAYPGSNIRIDANRGWEFEEAKEHLERLAPFGIEYCEEPLRDPGVATLRDLDASSRIPLALDESLHGEPDSSDWITSGVGQVVIIKPMIFGSLKKIFETYRLAVTHDYTTVFTSSLESGIGRMMTAILASGLGSSPFAHGLATGGLLKIDLWHDRAYIDSGYFTMPDGFGLGERDRPRMEDLALESLDL